ncbi:hypothetical protein ECANGB1_1059 [Enterospora canceri]|uniref:Uncharacterized protein n=1 Tax=Enterospora canceri TaxID=1081671 RepID=A0A1Y1S7L0_9MICR|nr:hypothetical protein ECANGB1_1059 [Enterospora canceri]
MLKLFINIAEATMSLFRGLFFDVYASSLSCFVAYAYFHYPEVLVHGRGNVRFGKVSKRYFVLFYLIGLIAAYRTFLVLFLIRRVIESLLYMTKTQSYMNVFHLVHGCSFYYILGIYVTNNTTTATTAFYRNYLVLNVLQGIAHYKLYVSRDLRYKNSHYYCEIALYVLYFYRYRDWFTFNILVYVLLFVVSTIRHCK